MWCGLCPLDGQCVFEQPADSVDAHARAAGACSRMADLKNFHNSWIHTNNKSNPKDFR
jgi:hypothetical protein